MEFFKFAVREKRIISFGITFAFISSFGQTFLISLFVPNFQEAFSLSSTSFGTLYSLATLGSAVSLPYLGAWIDRTRLKTYTFMVALGLMGASFLVAFSLHVAVLFVGLFLLRLTGQGLSSHTAKTSIARHYQSGRGKALSLVNLGHPIGEGLLPLLVTGLLSYITWRITWGVIGGGIGVIFLPLLLLMLGNTSFATEIPSKTPEKSSKETTNPGGDGNEQLLRFMCEARFWFLAPAAILPGFWITGLLLFQVRIAEQFGWTRELMATAFVSFAVGRIAFSLLSGPAIDRWSARRLFPLYLLPLGGGLVTAYLHPGNWSAFLYLGLLGVTLGAGGTLKSALWAEVYDTEVLGTVRSLYSSLAVLGTATCPFFLGWLLDLDVPVEYILMAAVGSVIAAFFLSWYGLAKAIR